MSHPSTDNEFVIHYPRASKNFWRTKIVVDVSLLEYRQHDVIEIICAIDSPHAELTRIYMSTPHLFSKFSKIFIDEPVAAKNAETLGANICRTKTSSRRDDDITHAFHDMAVKYVMLRLVVSLEGPPEVRLIALPGDSTKSNGQLDQICEKPVGFKEFDLICGEIKNERQAASLRIVQCSTSTCPVQNPVKIMPSRWQVVWQSIFRRIVFAMEVNLMKRRLKLMNSLRAIPCATECGCSGLRNVADAYQAYSQKIMFSKKSSPEVDVRIGDNENDDDTDDVDGQSSPDEDVHTDLPSSAQRSWEDVTKHWIHSQGGSKSSRKWNPGGSTLMERRLSTTTLLYRAEIRKTRYSLHPVVTTERFSNRNEQGDLFFTQRGVAFGPCIIPGISTDPRSILAPVDDKINDRFQNKCALLPLGNSAANQVRPTTKNSTLSKALKGGGVTSNTTMQGDNAKTTCSQHVVEPFDDLYKLEQRPRIKNTLSPIAWHNVGSCEKLTDRFGFYGAKSQNGFGSENRIAPSADYRKRHSTGRRMSNREIEKLSVQETRRKSSGSASVGYRSRRQAVVAEEIPRGTVLLAHLKNGLSFTKFLGAITSIRESFNISEKKTDNVCDHSSLVECEEKSVSVQSEEAKMSLDFDASLCISQHSVLPIVKHGQQKGPFYAPQVPVSLGDDLSDSLNSSFNNPAAMP